MVFFLFSIFLFFSHRENTLWGSSILFLGPTGHSSHSFCCETKHFYRRFSIHLNFLHYRSVILFLDTRLLPNMRVFAQLCWAASSCINDDNGESKNKREQISSGQNFLRLFQVSFFPLKSEMGQRSHKDMIAIIHPDLLVCWWLIRVQLMSVLCFRNSPAGWRHFHWTCLA